MSEEHLSFTKISLHNIFKRVKKYYEDVNKSAKLKSLSGFYIFSLVSLAVIVSLTVFNIASKVEPLKRVKTEVKVLGRNTKLVKERQFWINFLEDSPSYIDGWLELANIEDQLSNDAARDYALTKAKEINPNLDKVLEAEKALRGH